MAGKILVFGGAGFIGTNLCFSALERGQDVVIFDNLSRPGTALNIEMMQARYGEQVGFVRGDIREAHEVEAVFAQHPDIEAIFHLAGQVAVTTSIKDPMADFDINLRGTMHILEAMRKGNIQAPLLYASTNKVYGKMASVVVEDQGDHYAYRDYPYGISEDFPLDFHSPYGCSKGAADQYVLDYARIYGIKAVVFRQSCIYGAYQFGIEDQGWVAWFTIASMYDLPITIFGDGKQVRDVLFVDDLIAGYWLAIENITTTSGKAYNIGGAFHRLSLLELLAYLEEFLDKKIPVQFSETRQGDQKIFVCDIRKATTDFGWQPSISAQEGVRRLAGWMRENKHLFEQAGIIK